MAVGHYPPAPKIAGLFTYSLIYSAHMFLLLNQILAFLLNADLWATDVRRWPVIRSCSNPTPCWCCLMLRLHFIQQITFTADCWCSTVANLLSLLQLQFSQIATCSALYSAFQSRHLRLPTKSVTMCTQIGVSWLQRSTCICAQSRLWKLQNKTVTHQYYELSEKQVCEWKRRAQIRV